MRKRRQRDTRLLLVCLYVDDIIYMGSSQSMIDDFKLGKMNTYEMTILGLLHYFVGIRVKQEKDGIFAL